MCINERHFPCAQTAKRTYKGGSPIASGSSSLAKLQSHLEPCRISVYDLHSRLTNPNSGDGALASIYFVSKTILMCRLRAEY